MSEVQQVKRRRRLANLGRAEASMLHQWCCPKCTCSYIAHALRFVHCLTRVENECAPSLPWGNWLLRTRPDWPDSSSSPATAHWAHALRGLHPAAIGCLHRLPHLQAVAVLTQLKAQLLGPLCIQLSRPALTGQRGGSWEGTSVACAFNAGPSQHAG